MQLSRVYRGQSEVGHKRIVFCEFDMHGELPEGSWAAAPVSEFLLTTLPGVDKDKETPPAEPKAAEMAPAEPKAAEMAPAGIQSAPEPDMAAHNARIQEEAYAEGHRQGLADAAERFNGAIDGLGDALEEISRLRARLLRESQSDMLRLVMAIARQVIHAEVSANRDVVLSTIERALQAAVRSDSYQIKVHPEDLQQAMEKKPLFLASISSLKNITFQADETITRGGCLVESELGEVDATIDSQLEEIRLGLMAAVEQA